MNRFFKPYVGSQYHKGIKGKKVLILGASFYCNKVECDFYSKCTNGIIKDSSPFDDKCPVYKNEGLSLHDEPSHCVENADLSTYTRFASYIGEVLGGVDYEEVWSTLAFTNYVQYFLDANTQGFRDTRPGDLSERDFKAFIETVKELNPDIIVIWGTVTNTRLKEQNEYVIDKETLKNTGGYLCYMRVPGIDHDIALINPYHPSSSSWYSGLEEFDKYFRELL